MKNKKKNWYHKSGGNIENPTFISKNKQFMWVVSWLNITILNVFDMITDRRIRSKLINNVNFWTVFYHEHEQQQHQQRQHCLWGRFSGCPPIFDAKFDDPPCVAFAELLLPPPPLPSNFWIVEKKNARKQKEVRYCERKTKRYIISWITHTHTPPNIQV